MSKIPVNPKIRENSALIVGRDELIENYLEDVQHMIIALDRGVILKMNLKEKTIYLLTETYVEINNYFNELEFSEDHVPEGDCPVCHTRLRLTTVMSYLSLKIMALPNGEHIKKLIFFRNETYGNVVTKEQLN